MTRLDIVVPVYNEAQSAASFCALVAAFEAQVQARFGFSVHKIIVDDGSTDGSVGILSQTLAGSWEMVRLSRNFGKELAVLAGLDRSAGDYTLIMDADLQHSAEVALGMLAELHADREIDVVFARIAERSESRTRGWLSRRFYELMNAGQRYEIPANGGDFRVMRRPVVEAFRRLRDHQRFNKGLYAWAGFRQKAVDYMPAPRVAGSTKWSRLSLLALSVEAITSFSVVPLRMIALLGLVVALAGMAYGVSIIVEVIFNGVAVPGYPSLVVAVVVLGGFNLALLGVIGEYLWVAVSEGKDRPPYLVRDITSSAQQAGGDWKPVP